MRTTRLHNSNTRLHSSLSLRVRSGLRPLRSHSALTERSDLLYASDDPKNHTSTLSWYVRTHGTKGTPETQSTQWYSAPAVHLADDPDRTTPNARVFFARL